MSYLRLGVLSTIVRRFRPLSRCAFGVLVVVQMLLCCSHAEATCTAALSLTKDENTSCVTLFLTGGSGACPNSHVELFLSHDGGTYISQLDCPNSPCTQTVGGNCRPCSQGTHSWSLRVECSKPGSSPSENAMWRTSPASRRKPSVSTTPRHLRVQTSTPTMEARGARSRITRQTPRPITG